jgi:hypothetical protein
MKRFTASLPSLPVALKTDRASSFSAWSIRVLEVCNYHLTVHIQVMISREEWMAVSGAKQRIEAALQEWPGITSQPHRFGGTEYCMGRREIGHVHGDSLVDIPFPKTVRNEMVAGGRAEPHHILPDSGWVSIYLRQASDVDRAIELLRLSFEIANQRTAK